MRDYRHILLFSLIFFAVFCLQACEAEDYETAIANYSKAYQFDNTNVNTLYYLGNSYYESGDFENAA